MPLPLYLGQDQNDALQNWLKGGRPGTANPLQRLMRDSDMSLPDAPKVIPGIPEGVTDLTAPRPFTGQPTPGTMGMSPPGYEFPKPAAPARQMDTAPAGYPSPGEPDVHSPSFRPTDSIQFNRRSVPNYLASNDPSNPYGTAQDGLSMPGAQPAAQTLGYQIGSASPPDVYQPPTSAPVGPYSKVPTSRMTVEQPGSSVSYGFNNGEYTQPVGGSVNGRPIDMANIPRNQTVQDYVSNQADPTKWYKDLRRMINPTYAYGQVGQDAGETPATRQQFSDALGFIQGNARDAAHLGSVAREGDLNRKNALQIAQMNVDERAATIKDQSSVAANAHVAAEKAKWEKEHPGTPFPLDKEREIRGLYMPSVTGGPLNKAGASVASGASPATIATAGNANAGSNEPPPSPVTEMRKRLGGDAFDEIDKLLTANADPNTALSKVDPGTTIRKILESGKSQDWVSKNLDAIIPYLQIRHGEDAIKGMIGTPTTTLGRVIGANPISGWNVNQPHGVGESLRALAGGTTNEDRTNQAIRRWLHSGGRLDMLPSGAYAK